MKLENRIKAGKGEIKADLVLKKAKVVNVLSGEINESDVAISEGIIIGFGDYEAKEEIELDGLFLAPGFFDGHVHLESSMVTPEQYSKAVVPKGTTSVVTDPHEIANVLGIEGIKLLIELSRDIPLRIFFMLPSCVPATHLETSGAELSAENLSELIDHERVLGIAEVMNFPGVIFGQQDLLDKIKLGKGKRVDGHCPGLTGKELCAYIDAGISSDHECFTAAEALEKLGLGMHIMIREGTGAKNLADLIKIVNPQNSRRLLFATDDRHPEDLIKEGHIDYLIRKAVNLGLDPITAIQMATINTAEYFKLHDLGAVAPGYRADLVVLEDLKGFKAKMTFRDGQLVAQDGQALVQKSLQVKEPASSININWDNFPDFKIKTESSRARIIEVVPGQIITKQSIEELMAKDNEICPDLERDILKIAVIERHKATGNVGLGLVKGFGLKEGALASSVAHDSHNIIVVGTNDRDMLKAVKEVESLKGGLAVIKQVEVIDSLALPVAGLMSIQPLEEVKTKILSLNQAAHSLGCVLENPFMTLSFLALPVIPELKITDLGLVDVEKFDFVPLAVGSD